ncbi:MAG: EfeM/EfeO family lipoprotein [Microthrixaceae bacterium]|nr:EfeM/EfeO family lipoprotein [Microthrixaceae bacterium]
MSLPSKAGNDDEARRLYAPTRMYWESIEPVAESFGDLDPRLDLREADMEEGQEWTGWHQIEKQLWPPADLTELDSPEQRAEMADQLVADTEEPASRVANLGSSRRRPSRPHSTSSSHSSPERRLHPSLELGENRYRFGRLPRPVRVEGEGFVGWGLGVVGLGGGGWTVTVLSGGG